MSMRAAISGLFEEQQNSGDFVERHVRGTEGVAVPHTAIFHPSPELFYERYSDGTADACVGLDEKSPGLATAELLLTTPK